MDKPDPKDYEIKETEYEKAVAAIAKDKWKNYKQRFIPFENKFIADISKDTGAMKQRVAGKVNADVYQNIAPKLTKVDPTTGKTKTVREAMDVSGKAATASALATMGVDDNQAKLLQAAVDVGQSQSHDVTVNYSNLAKQQLEEQMGDKYLKYMEDKSDQQGFGQMLGMLAGGGMGIMQGFSGGGGGSGGTCSGGTCQPDWSKWFSQK